MNDSRNRTGLNDPRNRRKIYVTLAMLDKREAAIGADLKKLGEELADLRGRLESRSGRPARSRSGRPARSADDPVAMLWLLFREAVAHQGYREGRDYEEAIVTLRGARRIVRQALRERGR